MTDRKNQCQNCGEPFEGPEFFSFILKLRSKTVHCVRCQTENYFVPGNSASAWIMRLIALSVGVAIFLGVAMVMMAAGYNEATGTTRIRPVFLILGFILGSGAAWFLLNIFTWVKAPLSTDRKHKSISDYE